MGREWDLWEKSYIDHFFYVGKRIIMANWNVVLDCNLYYISVDIKIFSKWWIVVMKILIVSILKLPDYHFFLVLINFRYTIYIIHKDQNEINLK